jgi:hypothetical protein
MLKQDLIKRSLVGALAAAAVAFPSSSQAMFIRADGSRVAPTAAAVTALSPRTAPSQAHPVSASPAGFHWGDAGIGAGAVALASAVAAGAAMTRRQLARRRVAG